MLVAQDITVVESISNGTLVIQDLERQRSKLVNEIRELYLDISIVKRTCTKK